MVTESITRLPSFTCFLQGVELVAPWEEHSPLFKFISENFSHQAADMVLEGQELLVNIMQ